MKLFKSEKYLAFREYLSTYFNRNVLRNVIFFSGGIIIFITGCVIYGVILNLRDIPLREAMAQKGYYRLKNPNLIIERKDYAINLYEDTVLIKSYKASFGKNVSSPKRKAGDFATPIGSYNICSIDTGHQYHIFLRLNYPNLEDMTEALRRNIISQKEYDKLRFEFYYDQCPKLKTQLGVNIGIHGIGRLNYIFKYLPFVFNWTDGSIAISNENIDELYSVIRPGTKVVIK